MSSLPVRGLGKKAWRGKPCAYCDEHEATGRDHIFARSFFPPANRGDLPQAPACDACAGRKSRLESELAAVLPLAANHSDAPNLLSTVPEKILGNARLRRHLEEHGAAVDEEARVIDLGQVDDLEFDGGLLIELFEMIVRGLYFHHWQMRLAPEFTVRARAFPRTAAMPVLDLFKTNGGAHVQADLGNGAFLYQGLRTADNPSASLWRFRILGGVTLTDAEGERRTLDEFLVMSLRREFFDRIAAE